MTERNPVPNVAPAADFTPAMVAVFSTMHDAGGEWYIDEIGDRCALSVADADDTVGALVDAGWLVREIAGAEVTYRAVTA